MKIMHVLMIISMILFLHPSLVKKTIALQRVWNLYTSWWHLISEQCSSVRVVREKNLFEKKVIILDLFNYILTNCLLPSLKRHSVAMKKSFMHNFQHEINLQFCYLVTVWSMLHVTQFVETQDRAFYYQSCMSWFRIMISKILLT